MATAGGSSLNRWDTEKFSDYKKRLRVALGEEPPDKLFVNGKVLNVFTGEILSQDVALSGDRIAFVQDRTNRPPVGERTEVYDLEGKTIVPGYFDPHAHTDLFYTPWEFVRSVVATGTTALFSDSHDMANGLGMDGFIRVLELSKAFPVRFLSGVPLASPPYPVEGEDLYDLPRVRRLLKLGKIIRSGSELTPWVKVVREDGTTLKKLHTVRRATGRLEGHTVGAKGRKLGALVASGITSCHEAITPEDVEERLRMGLYVMIRQGSIRREFERLHPFFKRYHPRVMLTPDGLFADEIVEKGYMNHVLEEAIRYGADPVSVIRMVTLNPAVYFGLEAHLGGIAPGRLADFNVLEDVHHPTPLEVWVGGRRVDPGEEAYIATEKMLDKIPSSRPFEVPPLGPEDFEARYPKGFPDGIPVIDIVNHTVTGLYSWKPSGRPDGTADPAEDVMKVALIHRGGPDKGMGIGYVHGFGLDGETQIASTVAHETHNLLVMGADDGEMAIAANEAVEMGGGVVVRSRGKTLYRWPLPVGGMMSDQPMEEIAKALLDLRRILRERGSSLPDPLWTYGFLSFTSILRLRITISGVYDVQKGVVLYNAKA